MDGIDYPNLTQTWREDIDYEAVVSQIAPVVDADVSTLDDSGKRARDAWDKYYELRPKGYQDRKYIEREWGTFKDEHLDSWKQRQSKEGEDKRVRVLEAGCGVGNLLFPLAELRSNFTFVAIDISRVAVNQLLEKASELGVKDRVVGGVCDLSCEDIPKDLLPQNGVDAATMIFTLSAIDPLQHIDAISRVFRALHPGGVLYFRDHGQYDVVQLKHAKKGGEKLGRNLYVRENEETLAYYFTIEEVAVLMSRVGFEIVDCQYLVREQYNRKKRQKWTHVWVTGHFRKPI